jgi:hypothetical protein
VPAVLTHLLRAGASEGAIGAVEYSKSRRAGRGPHVRLRDSRLLGRAPRLVQQFHEEINGGKKHGRFTLAEC